MTDFSSLELAPAYDAANLAQSKAAEIANANSAAKRSMLTEAKHFKEQTAEVKQWEKLLATKVSWCLVHADVVRMRLYSAICCGGCITSPMRSTSLPVKSSRLQRSLVICVLPS